MALMHLVQRRAAERSSPPPRIVTINHGLRAEAVEECAFVQSSAQALGLNCDILDVGGDISDGNLQEEARNSRYAAVRDWATQNDIKVVATGHTMTDQAETVLMRLARGSGVDGLSAMASDRIQHGMRWVRPLLPFSRSELRDWLTETGATWVEDPSNEDDAFHRIKLRKAMPMLEELGFSEARLAETARHMQRTRDALEQAVHQLSLECAHPTDFGSVKFDLEVFCLAPVEVQTRLLTKTMSWITGENFKPRYASLRACLEQVMQGKTSTLHGVILLPKGDVLHLTREPNAVKTNLLDRLWDNRWELPPEVMDARLLFPDRGELPEEWAEFGLPRTVWASLPVDSASGRLLFLPSEDSLSQSGARLVRGRHSFTTYQTSH